MGLSTTKPDRTICDWPKDVEEFLDSLQLDKVGLIGYSAGGPYALACCAFLPHRLNRVAVVSSVGPPNTPNATRVMPAIYKLAWFLAAYWPSMLSRIIVSGAEKARLDPIDFHRQDISLCPPYDREMMQRHDVEAMFCESIVELYGRHQELEIAREFNAYGRDWGFNLEDLGCVRNIIRVWHGDKDQGSTLAMGEYIANQIKCNLVVHPDKGHMLYFEIFKDVVEWLNEM